MRDWTKNPHGSEVPMVVDEKTAIMSESAFRDLSEYSTSLPTGTYIGKRWKRATYNKEGKAIRWLLGEYAEHSPPDPKRVLILWRELLVVD